MDMDKATYQAISNRIGALFGFFYAEKNFGEMLRCVQAAAKAVQKSTEPEQLLLWLSSTPLSNADSASLAKHLTIGETYFFREKPALDLFSEKIIPELIEQRKGKNQRIRIWSAGCSSGEEPYTLAIMLKEMLPHLDHWKIDLIATDLNLAAIQKALGGRYTPWSFRETPAHIKDKYFVQKGNLFEISDEIKKMVQFSTLNLITARFPAPENNTNQLDVIFCRNVLMYLKPENIKAIIARFHESLIEGGWFITSQVELNDAYFGNFNRKTYKNGIFYRKEAIPAEVESSKGSFLKNKNSLARLKKEVIISDKKRPRSPQLKHTLTEKPQEDSAPSVQNFKFLFEAAKYADCIQLCLAQMEKNPSIDTGIILVRSYANLGDLKQARHWCDRLIKANGNSAELYYLHAFILEDQNEPVLAEKNLTKALYLQPNHLPSLFAMGNILRRNQKKQQAINYYQQLIQQLDLMTDEFIIDDFDGLTAGRLREMTQTMMQS